MGNSQSARVLIVDDDPIQIGLCQLLLESGGYDGIPLDIRASGVDSAPESGIDLILLDAQQQPSADRLQIAQALRRKYPNAPILLLTDCWTADNDLIPHTVAHVWKCDAERLLKMVRDRVSSRS